MKKKEHSNLDLFLITVSYICVFLIFFYEMQLVNIRLATNHPQVQDLQK